MAEATETLERNDLLRKDIESMLDPNEVRDIQSRAERIKKEYEEDRDRVTLLQQQGKKDSRSLETRMRKHEEYMESTEAAKRAEERLERGLPAIVLREKEKSEVLEKYGWDETGMKEVSDRLMDPEIFQLTDDAAQTAIENFIGAGLTVDEVLEKLTKEKYQETKQEFDDRSQQGQTRTPDLDAKQHLLREIGLKEEWQKTYTERFILLDDSNMHEHLKREYDQSLPANINEFAWQINFDDPHMFGVRGRYPVLQMEVREVEGPDGTKRLAGKYKVNQANIMRWVRERMWYFQEKDEDEFTDYMSMVRLPKSMRPVDLNEVFDNKARYFTDEDGHDAPYNGLYNQMLAEIIGMMHLRKHDLEYMAKMGSGEALNKQLQDLYYKSKLTKLSFGTSYFNTMANTPLDYRGDRSDDTVGSAFTTLLLSHYNFGDLPELIKVLGEDSEFFTREGMMKAIQEVYETKFNARDKIQSHDLSKFLGDKDKAKNFENAFGEDGFVKVKRDEKGNILRDKDGNILDEDEKHGFTKFINWYADGMQQSHILQDVMYVALRNALYDRYDFRSKEQNMFAKDNAEGQLKRDETSYKIAWLMVHSMQRFTGLAVKNDVNSTGWDYAYKWLETEAYRRKMATISRGNGAGNPYTIGMFKSTMMDFMRGVRTSEAHVKVFDQFGNPVMKDGKQATRKKTILEVFQDINNVKKKEKEQRSGLDNQFGNALKVVDSNLSAVEQMKEEVSMAEKADDQAAVIVAKRRLEQAQKELSEAQQELMPLQHQLRHFNEEHARDSKQVAGQLVFHENTMRDYAINHIDKAQKVYDQIIGAKEINFDKFIKFDTIRGITFDRAEFTTQFQQGFLHPLRYLFSTYGELNFNMPIRYREFKYRDVKNDKDVFEYKTMPLGEAMFGYEILNIPHFRMKEKNADGSEGKRYLIDPKNGRYIIDYEKVQNNKAEAYKQWALMKLAGDLWSHINRHSTDPAYDMHHYLNIIEAIEAVPGGLDGDETSLKKAGVVRHYFDHHQIQWLRKQAGATNFRLYRNQILSDLFRHHRDKEPYMGTTFKLFFAGIFKGYGG